MITLYYIEGMTEKKPLTLAEFASLGGKARSAKLSKARRREIAVAAGIAAGAVHKHKAKNRQSARSANR
jgi:hypothetical protein